ncbi:MAG: hypothetical protein HKN24_01405 [Acidimicrobiales bacterium]|nr:hypothetical protein [Acidimicrobiia bacterium]MBT8251182.1 hypothetical protein [Acidimicrobiia bacterium]NNE94666.1 hypothetical protein [Acidimicrobiales bacterium]NNL29346.1 hypothetical protein [Acidimicrobiia bacterium]
MEATTQLLIVYVLYGVVAIYLVVWLAKTLYKNGETFLMDVFSRRKELAQALNRMLVTGFYMLNLGYALLLLPGERPSSPVEASELLISKLGILLVSLGVIHFVNMFVFWRIRSRKELETAAPPVLHRGVLEPHVEA